MKVSLYFSWADFRVGVSYLKSFHVLQFDLLFLTIEVEQG